jgi:hypothetical protein
MESKTNQLLNSLLRSSGNLPESNDYEAVTEIALDSLTATQHLLIETTNSTYSFAVTDPVQRLGVLIGGALAGRRAGTFLVGARSRKAGDEADFARLRVGSRAVFLFSSESGLKRVITSRITRLVQKRARAETTAPDFGGLSPVVSEAF